MEWKIVMTRDRQTSDAGGANSQLERPEYAEGRFRYRIQGSQSYGVSDIYYHLLEASWLEILFWAFGGYLVINTIFALLYLLGGNAITGAEAGNFFDAFNFSVQTFSTIGFGTMSPTSPFTNLLVVGESFAGLVAVALGAGVIFAKFARPSARVVFSKKMVVHRRDGVPTLQFRIANERRREIYAARMQATMLVEEKTAEGQAMRRFYTLPLERSEVPVFTVTWTGFHQLNDESPLHARKGHGNQQEIVFILVMFEGRDSVTLQTVQARHVYTPVDVFPAHAFADIIEHEQKDQIILHLDRLHDVIPINSD
jgi:inward rectifier potassium channel